MGYFSELDINNACYEDHSYPSPEMELRWRIEDLRSRLDEITNGEYGITAHYFMGCQFSKDNLAFTPPKYFSRASDIIISQIVSCPGISSMPISIEVSLIAFSGSSQSDMANFSSAIAIASIIDDPIDCPEERMEAAA